MKIEPESTGEATYCPEDDKLRLYVGRVPRPEYDALRAEGWTSTPKQDCDFVATWTPSREDTALAYSPDGIEDEDQSPQDRAADRAERFAGYREKREGEALGHADTYEGGPSLHGYQSQALAERRAAQHDREGTRAVTQWGKAEYWQRRTAGVIGHALYVSAPGVRMGRIKTLEAEQRKHEAGRAEHRANWERWEQIAVMPGAGELLPLDADGYVIADKLNAAQRLAYATANNGHYMMSLHHPDDEGANAHARKIHGACWYGFSAYDFLTHDTYGGSPFRRMTPKEYAELYLKHATRPDDYGARWSTHYALRLAYENQMLEAQGGRAAFVEMEPGGWLGSRQVLKVNKSPATGRVVSVQVLAMVDTRYNFETRAYDRALRPVTIKTERMSAEVYRAPTDEERAAFAAKLKAERQEAKKSKPKAPPTINPTREDAERLQVLINAEREARGGSWYKPGSVQEITQATYSENSKGAYARCEIKGIHAEGKPSPRSSNMYEPKRDAYAASLGPVLCKVRVHDTGGGMHVLVLTDKPQKALPASVWVGLKANEVAA